MMLLLKHNRLQHYYILIIEGLININE